MPIVLTQELSEAGAASQVVAARVFEDAAGFGSSSTLARRFERALELLGSGVACRAYSELSALANQGHSAASRIALMMARRGTSLFGGVFPATVQERACWQRNAE